MQKMMVIAVLLLLVALVGCQAPAPVAEPKPQPVEAPQPKPAARAPVAPAPAPIPIPTASDRALAEGVRLFDAGDFNGAIKELLGAKEIWDVTTSGSIANKLAAHKYLAFSYCVTNRRTQCRQQFVDAIKLDTNFSLEPAEKTHPVWGPEFDRAKVQASAPAAPAGRQTPSAAPPPNPPKAK